MASTANAKVMDRGEIREVGSHRQLLEKGGHYAALYHEQFKAALEPEEALVG